MLMEHSLKCKRMVAVAFIFIVLFCIFLPSVTTAGDDRKHHNTYKRHENSGYSFDSRKRIDNHGRNGDGGNEITGQITAWLLVTANLTIALSIVLKAVIRYFPLGSNLKSSIKKLNRCQKKYLMQFHYVLNPVAFGFACFHFLLSSCRSSSLPEWGMIMILLMVFLGFILKFQLFPRKSGRFFYRLHTTPVLIIITVCVLVVGHQLVE